MKKISVGNKNFAIVNDNDYDKLKVFNWKLHNGYAERQDPNKKGRYLFMHWDIIGKPAKGLVTDHINRNRLDNRKINLRHCEFYMNIRNSKRFENTRAYYEKGISIGYLSSRKRWQAQTNIKGKKKWLGYFNNLKEALAKFNLIGYNKIQLNKTIS